jgi:peptide/nickel transport system permease protein
MAFFLRRIGQSVVVLLVMSVLAFAAVYMIGNPVDILIDPSANEAERQAAIVTLGLDKPLWEQYLVFLNNLVHLDLGRSFSAAMPVTKVLALRLPATIELTLVAYLISFIGVPLGVIAGLRPDTFLSKTIMTGSILGISLPNFWIGLMLMLVFSVNLGWLPSTGRGDTVEILGTQWALFTSDGLRHLILPGITLSLFNIALLIRLARAGVREVMLTDYIKFGRAKGLRKGRLVWLHAFKNILIPIVTVQGLELANLLAGAILTEVIFAYPGIGRAAIEAINYLDRPVIVGYMMFVVTVFVAINLIVDLLYAAIDPRVRLSGGKDG